MKTTWILFVVAGLAVVGCRKSPSASSVAEVNPALPPIGEKLAPGEKQGAVPKPVEQASKPAIDRSAQVAVIGYHRFVEKVRRPDTEITPAAFEEQMKALKDGGIAVISLKDFQQWRHGEKSIPARSAIITIDDGFDSAYTVAWPILKKFGYPFTLFIYTDYVKGGRKAGGASMSWEQLAELRDAGVSIQSHTVSHPDLRARTHRGADYESWLWNELNGSKEMIEQKLGVKVTALAVPYGRYDNHVKEVATKAGYEMLFTVNGQKLTFDSPADSLGRYIIEANQPKIFASAMNFGSGGGGAPNAVTPLELVALDPQPGDSSTSANATPLIRANLKSVKTTQPLDPSKITVRLSGVGLLPAKYDPHTQMLSYQVTTALPPGTYTVILTVDADGRKMEGHWRFTVNGQSSAHLAHGV